MTAHTTPTPGSDIQFPEVRMHLHTPREPGTGRIVRSEICTAGRKAAGFVRHVEIDVSGTNLAGACLAGQSFGVIPPGQDAKGRPHAPRLYSLASPSRGEDGQGKVISTTVKRTIDENWEDHRLFLGVASNFLCDAQVGDEVRVSGPNGKRFLLPANPEEHDYLFLATGTGVAPFRGMALDLLASRAESRIHLVMGAPYATDLLYHDDFLKLAEEHPNFEYSTAISREGGTDGRSRMYVHDRIAVDRDRFAPLLNSPRTLIYICGVAGMELGAFQQLAKLCTGSELEQYLQVDRATLADVDNWSRRMIHREVKPTRRVFLEVYA